MNKFLKIFLHLPEKIAVSSNLPQDGVVGGISYFYVNKTGHLRNHVKNSLHLSYALYISKKNNT